MDDRYKILSEISYMFYEEGLTQVEISKKIGLSRPTIAGMLKEAKEKGIVKIIIQSNDYNLLQTQSMVTEKYKLKSCQITSYKGEEVTKQEVGNLCARFVEENINSINALGIGWGTTLYSFVNSSKYLNAQNLKIIPLVGGGGHADVNFHSNVLVFSLAKKFDCKANFFYAPAIAENVQMKETFEKSGLVKEVMEEGKMVDMALIGVGNPLKSSTYRKLKYFSDSELEEIRKKNIVGDALTSFYTANGDVIPTRFTDRMIGQSIDDLKNIKDVVVVASGIDKYESIQGILNLGFVSHLITDDLNANKLLLN